MEENPNIKPLQNIIKHIKMLMYLSHPRETFPILNIRVMKVLDQVQCNLKESFFRKVRQISTDPHKIIKMKLFMIKDKRLQDRGIQKFQKKIRALDLTHQNL